MYYDNIIYLCAMFNNQSKQRDIQNRDTIINSLINFIQNNYEN